MTRLHLQLDRIEEIGYALHSSTNRLSSIVDQVSSLHRQIDYKVSARNQIGIRTHRSEQTLEDLVNRIEALRSFIHESVYQYGMTERRIQGEAQLIRDIVALPPISLHERVQRLMDQFENDPLRNDPLVQRLIEEANHHDEFVSIPALEQLREIFEARNNIARAQTAWFIYMQFNNTEAAERAHAYAMELRKLLREHGIDEQYFAEDLSLSGFYSGEPLDAVSYDPSIPIQTPMPKDNQYRYLLGLIIAGGSQAAWAKQQLAHIHARLKEIGRAQRAWTEYKERGMNQEADNAHLYAEKIRDELKNEFGLSEGMVDGVNYEHLWTEEGPAGKYLNDENTMNQYDTSGTQHPNPNEKYKHITEQVQSITDINEGKFGDEMDHFIDIFKEHQDLYERISDKTGVPAELIAALHYRENPGKFDIYLHNGQKLGQETTIHPAGIYFDNFEEAAVDALLSKSYVRDTYQLHADSNDLVAMLAYAEAYNGWGYYNRDEVSPYVYSGTDIYTSGKYTSDGVYDPTKVDGQPGVYILLAALEEEFATIPAEPESSGTIPTDGIEFEANVQSAGNILGANPNYADAVTIPEIENFPLYKQGDSRYGGELIGLDSSDTMANIGCTTTALAAVNAWETSGEWINSQEPHPGRYNDTVEYTANGEIHWPFSRPGEVDFAYNDSQFESNVQDAIDRGNPVLFAVNNDAHWMVAVGYMPDGDVIVYNPADGMVGTFDEMNEHRESINRYTYTSISRYREF